MFKWFSCYLSGQHDYGMWCQPGEIFLRCVHCGRRSNGWQLGTHPSSTSHTRTNTNLTPVTRRALTVAATTTAAASEVSVFALSFTFPLIDTRSMPQGQYGA